MPALPPSAGFAGCTSQSCVDTLASLSSYIDHSIDPCNNFYQYSCGSWLKNSSIPDYSSTIGSFADIQVEINENINTMLSGSYQDLLGMNLAPDFVNDSSRAVDEDMLTKLKMYYETCLDTDSIDKLGPTPIYPLLATISNTQNITELLIVAGEVDVWPFLGFHIDGDYLDPDNVSVALMTPTLTLGSPSYYASPDVLQLYQTYLTELVSRVLNPNETSYQEAAQKSNLTVPNQQDISGLVERFIMLEAQIANFTANSLSDLATTDSISEANRQPISGLQTNYPFVDWAEFLRAFVPEGRPLPEHIDVYYPSYMGNVTALLQTTDAKSIQDYVAINTILTFAESLDTSTAQIYQTLYGTLVTGTTVITPREDHCAKRTQKGFDRAVARYLVMTTIGGKEERDRLIEMVDNIHNTWIDRLETNDWLDNETRAKAVDKMKKTTYWIMYSLASPDLRSPASVQDYYRTLNVTSTSSFENDVAINHFLGAYEPWQIYGIPRQKNELPTQEWAVANAFYLPSQNMISITPGILRSPAYKNNGPLFYNYGAIGFIIAHEFAHGFDSNGRYFDADGRLANWWTNTTAQIFNEKATCFTDQYSNFTVIGPNNSVVNVNGATTLSENLADNAGLIAGYASFKNAWNTSTAASFPGTDLTLDQLFFISHAQFFCTNMKPEIMLLTVLSDTHSPPEWRVNGPAQNSEDFANAFQCPKNSRMNPEQKCALW